VEAVSTLTTAWEVFATPWVLLDFMCSWCCALTGCSITPLTVQVTAVHGTLMAETCQTQIFTHHSLAATPQQGPPGECGLSG
jgi:hypothetical protein